MNIIDRSARKYTSNRCTRRGNHLRDTAHKYREQYLAFDSLFRSVLFERDFFHKAIDSDSYFDLTPLLVDKDVGVLERKTQRATLAERQAA